MKHRICALAALGLLVSIGTGCAKKPPADSSVTDVSAQPTPMSPEMTYSPEPADATWTPDAGTAAPSAGGTYTVKKGDTLYGIARAHYGDGKQWQRIADANPGLSPSSLKAGQTISIP